MSQAILRHPPGSGDPVKRLTVDQYHKMIESGILQSGEPYELLDGILVHKDRSAVGEDPVTIGSQHMWVIQRLIKLGRKLESLNCHLRPQGPILIPPLNEPEPDAAIARGSEDDYVTKNPLARDITCAIEVADSSLQHDRTAKQRIYADAGIGQYIIINLVDKTIEVYSEPQIGRGRYARTETLLPSAQVAFAAPNGKQLLVNVKTLLPTA